MRPGFSPLSGLIQEGLRRYHLEQGVKAARAVGIWDAVAGPAVAAVTMADIVRDGALYVFTRSSAWSQELSMLRDRLVAAVNAELGADTIKDIRFQVKRFSRPSVSPTQPLAPRALTAADRAALEALSTRLDEEAANPIRSLATRHFPRPDRAGVCTRCGGPAAPDQAVCPFCR